MLTTRTVTPKPIRTLVHEDAIKVACHQGAGPDYCFFRIGGTRKFFLEAKKPSVKIKEDIAAASSFAVTPGRRSSRYPSSLDFEEFAVYDCRVRPTRQTQPRVPGPSTCPTRAMTTNGTRIASIFSTEVCSRLLRPLCRDDQRQKGHWHEVTPLPQDQSARLLARHDPGCATRPHPGAS